MQLRSFVFLCAQNFASKDFQKPRLAQFLISWSLFSGGFPFPREGGELAADPSRSEVLKIHESLPSLSRPLLQTEESEDALWEP